MKKLFKKEPSALDDELGHLYEELENEEVDTDRYHTLLKRVADIKDIQGKEKNIGVSKDTLLIVGANLVGILLVLNYEKAGVITSKAFGSIIKGRV